MARPRDLQIFWVVFFAGGFWVAIWQHEAVAKLWKTVSTAAVAMTSGIRPAQAQPAQGVEQPSTSAAKNAAKR